jgi:hypothetical protein
MAQPKEVGEDRLPEMDVENLDAELDTEIVEQPPDDDSSAEQDASETTVEKAQPESKTKTQGKPNKKNLDDDEDFRKYKSARDKREAEIKADYERKLRERDEDRSRLELAQQQAQLAGLQQGLASAVDDQERAQYIDQIAAIKSQTYVSAERAWARYVAQQAKDEGLDPTEFDPTKYRGQQGAIQFERDLAKAAKERYAKEAAEYKKMASPDAIAALVKQQVAKALREQGMDSDVEAGSPEGGKTNGDSWEHDMELFNKGKLPRGYLAKKYGSTSRS